MNYLQFITNNRETIINCNLCLCCDCLSEYYPNKIRDWCDNNKTAICPYCANDTVLVSPKYTNKYTTNDVIAIFSFRHNNNNNIIFRNDETYSINEMQYK